MLQLTAPSTALSTHKTTKLASAAVHAVLLPGRDEVPDDVELLRRLIRLRAGHAIRTYKRIMEETR